jgi:hypothetical protein
MGTRGPVPKRADQRRRTNKPASPVTQAEGASSVSRPEADESWHEVARRWYESLGASGQEQFYEPSDWAIAYLMAESISRDLKPQFVGFVQTGRDTTEPEYAAIPLKGASLSAYLKAMSDLLATEGARRRAGVELQRGVPVEMPANVIDYRARASARA